MSDLTSLRERLGKATGADRELDARISVALFEPHLTVEGNDGDGLRCRDKFGIRHISFDGVPRYTKSLDAALGLVEAKVKDAAQAQTIFHKAVRAWSSWALMHRAEMGFDQLPRFVLSALLAALSEVRP